MLRAGVQALLQEQGASDPALTNEVFKHPLVAGLKGNSEAPSYLPSTVFAKALRQILLTGTAPAGSNVTASVTSPSPALGKALAALTSGNSETPFHLGQAFRGSDIPTEKVLA